jgi:oligopeptide transport system substrate-binding protein
LPDRLNYFAYNLCKKFKKLNAMRKIILLLISILFLWGCQKAPKPQSGILKVSNGAEPQSIDPHRCTGHPGIRVIGALFEGLVIRGLNSPDVRPGIAKSWNVSKNGLNYSFTLRQCQWSNSSAITAYDFVKSWKRLINPKTGAEYASLLSVLKNGKSIISGHLPADSLGIQAINDTLLIIELEQPTGYFLHLCAFEPLFPVFIDSITKHGEKWTAPENIVSNGPFILKFWRPNNKMVLKKNPNYWDHKSVQQKDIHILPIEIQETAYKMFLNNEIDWIFSIPLNRIASARSLPGFINHPQYGVYYYSLNITNPKLNNVFFRRALSYAINRQKIVDHVTNGGEKPATGFVPIISSIPYSGVNRVLFNPEKAREYLLQAGYSKSNPPPRLQIFYNTSEGHKKIAEVISQMWKEELNVETELLNNEWKIYLQTTRNLKHEVARSSWIADYPDPYSFLELGMSTNGNNRTGYNNPEYDKCLSLSQTITSPIKRYSLLSRCEEILIDDASVIPIYFYAINELRNPRIHNAIANPMGMYSWKDLYLKN